MDEKQRECFTKAYDKAAELILKATDEFTEKFPPSASVNNFYQPDINYEWTPGFWTGEVWLAWEKTGNEKLKKTAEIEVQDFYRRIRRKMALIITIWVSFTVLPVWQPGNSPEMRRERKRP